MAVALAVVVYGGLLVVSWERQARPQPGAAAARNQPSAPAHTPVRGAEPVEIPGGVRFEHAVVRDSPPTSPPAAVVATPRAAAAVATPPSVRPPVVTPLESARGAVAEDAPLELEAAVAVASAPPADGAREPAAVAESPGARAAGAIDAVAAERSAIGRVLGQYRESYNALDAASASTIWKGLDTKALERAFATLRSQEVSFDHCDVALTSADRATARCRGVLNYVPKIGDGNPQQRRLSWTIDFQRAADRWLIASVSAR